jgi:hypothetical protein
MIITGGPAPLNLAADTLARFSPPTPAALLGSRCGNAVQVWQVQSVWIKALQITPHKCCVT